MCTKIILPKDFAAQAHDSQSYGDQPYTVHLDEVVGVLNFYLHYMVDKNEGYYLPGVLEAAAWLHDTLEDTDVTHDDLVKHFGGGVADLVEAVSDEPGKNRKERKAKTLPKTRKYGYLAVAIKLCDRIANVKNCVLSRDYRLFDMYKKEHALFRSILYSEVDGLDPMWDHLEDWMVDRFSR